MIQHLKPFVLFFALILLFVAGCGDNDKTSDCIDFILTTSMPNPPIYTNYEIFPVKKWIVTLSTKTGDIIYESSGNLYAIINNIFYENKIEKGVQFSPETPLKGVFVGYGEKKENLYLTIKNNDGMEIKIDLQGKKMVRKTTISPWELDKSQFPEDIKKFLEIEE